MTGAGYANADALVSADWLAEHLDDPAVRVVEVDVSPKSHAEGHIAGAVFWDIYKVLKDPSYHLRDAAAFAALLNASGIANDTTVVFTGYGPALGYWLLKWYGHNRARILNLSKAQWHADGRPWSTESPAPATAQYVLAAPSDVRATHEEVAASVGVPGRALLDVRSEAEFRGERFWPSGAPEPRGRPGRIPGALHVPLDTVYNTDGSFADAATLRAVFPAELDDLREVVTYCTIGNRASVAWFVLAELLGRPRVRVYDGSWAEWGFLPDAPIAAG